METVVWAAFFEWDDRCPTPPVAAWMSTRWPHRRRAFSKRAYSAVQYTTGMVAASCSVIRTGMGQAIWGTGTEWAVAQIGAAAGDYAYDSRFWNLVSIGLNNQTIHHLFPGIHAYHYPALARLFRPVFEKHGLSVHRWTQTYTQSLLAHVAFVYDRTTV